jgi:O-antigen/teichoic acid export membrane protein
MADIRRSLLLNLLSTNGANLVQFGVTVILARLLSPEEIGIFSITAVLIAIAHFFRDFGVVSYLQQTKDITRDNVAAALGVMLTSSWLVALLTYLAGPYAAAYYKQPGIADVMAVLALGYVFIPFGAVTHSLLTRDYRAKEQAYVRVFSTFSYAISAIYLAYNGHSYMSLAWANLVNIVVTAIAYIPFRPAAAVWLPSFKGWRQVVSFGAGATFGNALSAVNNAIPDLVLGKLSGPHDVGVMSRAMSTTQLLNYIVGPTIGYAVLPYFSKAHHSGQELASLLTKGTAYLTGLMWSALACTAIFAEPLTLLLYGETWAECIPVIQIICFMLILGTPFGFLSAAYMAIGRPHLASQPTVVSLLSKGISIAILYDGTLTSFAWAMVLAALMQYPVQMWLQKRQFGLAHPPFLMAQARSLIVAIACGGVAYLVRSALSGLPHGVVVLAGGLTVPATWLVAIWLSGHPLKHELERVLTRYPLIATKLNIPASR